MAAGAEWRGVFADECCRTRRSESGVDIKMNRGVLLPGGITMIHALQVRHHNATSNARLEGRLYISAGLPTHLILCTTPWYLAFPVTGMPG